MSQPSGIEEVNMIDELVDSVKHDIQQQKLVEAEDGQLKKSSTMLSIRKGNIVEYNQ